MPEFIHLDDFIIFCAAGTLIGVIIHFIRSKSNDDDQDHFDPPAINFI